MFAHEAVVCKVLLVMEIGRCGPGVVSRAGEMRKEESFLVLDRFINYVP